ncbi:MAG: putative zinc-binding protein [Thermacetogeniaceae bacterium]
MGGETLIEQGLTYLVACAGACSNFGQLSMQVLLRLGREKYGKPFCLAGLGAHLPSFLERAKEGSFIVIDGCPQQCALKTVEHAGAKVAKNVVIAKLGIEKKTGDFEISPEEVEKAFEQVRGVLAGE